MAERSVGERFVMAVSQDASHVIMDGVAPDAILTEQQFEEMLGTTAQAATIFTEKMSRLKRTELDWQGAGAAIAAMPNNQQRHIKEWVTERVVEQVLAARVVPDGN